MISKEKIDRINELAKKKKSEEGLTPEEAAERKALHQEYIQAVRDNLRATLEVIEFVDDDQPVAEEVVEKVEE